MRTWQSGIDAFDPVVREEVERLLAVSPALRDVLKITDDALPMTGRDSIGELFRVNLLDVCREVKRAAVLEHGRRIVEMLAEVSISDDD